MLECTPLKCTPLPQTWLIPSVLQKALQKLIRGNELELAVSVGLVLEGLEELTSVAAELLSRRCETLGKW